MAEDYDLLQLTGSSATKPLPSCAPLSALFGWMAIKDATTSLSYESAGLLPYHALQRAGTYLSDELSICSGREPREPGHSKKLLAAVAAGVRLYDLAQPLEASMPVSPSHPQFEMILRQRHGDEFDVDGSSSASELIVMGGHLGTHVDALSHVSLDDRLYGGARASAAQTGAAFRRAVSKNSSP